MRGQTLHITSENAGCNGAGHWLCGVQTRDREDFVKFLVEEEGLRASHELINSWLDVAEPYRQKHPHLLIGPLKKDMYQYLKTVTFLVDADRLALLVTGAYYHSRPVDPPPVIAPFGSGCSALIAAFDDLDIAQASIGATDTAMRRHLPPDILAFTVTRPMFERLCALDENSFLYKGFWSDLKKARGIT